MSNSKHSVILKSTPKIGLRSGSRNINDSQATPKASGTNEEKKSFRETVKKTLSEKSDGGESLFDIIRNIFKEQFKIRQSNIKELINSNVYKTNERLDKLSSEFVDLTASLEFTQKKLTRNYSRCHRIGLRKTKAGQDRDGPRTVVCRLNRFKDKQHILNNAKKLKNTGIFIYKDFSKDTMELRKSLWE